MSSFFFFDSDTLVARRNLMAKDQNQKPEENGNPSWVSSICAPKNTLENYVGMADPTQHNQK
jgi:hypothetical protein